MLHEIHPLEAAIHPLNLAPEQRELGEDSPNIECRSKFEYDGMSKQKVMHIPAILKWSLP